MPWGRIDDTWYDHPKLDELDDAHEWPDRLAAAGLSSLAWSWCNRFLTDGKVPRATVAKLGGTTDLADQLVRVGLWETAVGGYQIHDFLVYNDSAEQVRERRAAEAARKAAYRASRRPGGTTNGTGHQSERGVPPGVPVGHVAPEGVPVGQEAEDVPGGVPPGVPADSRARARGRTPDPTRPDPSRPTESLTRESRATDRADIQALHDRGWKRVTAKQRAVLDEVLGRHDVTGPAFAAEVIRATPAEADPLAAVMDADRLWQASQRKRADAEQASWNGTKADEKADAATVLAELEASL